MKPIVIQCPITQGPKLHFSDCILTGIAMAWMVNHGLLHRAVGERFFSAEQNAARRRYAETIRDLISAGF